MKSKYILLLALTLISHFAVAKNNPFIQIELNQTLAVFNFLETANGARSVSQSYKAYIDKKLGQSAKFQDLAKRYHALNLAYSYELEGYPKSRHAYKNTKDLIWIAASNAKNIDDLNERILGYLPYETQREFIDILKSTKPIYADFIGKKTKKQSKRILKQLSKYTDKIEELFFTISHFLGSQWNHQTPFKVMLYPIPLKQGHTTAIPKGNALIVGFLAENKEDYKNRLGIIIHEMVHILYGSQSKKWQNDIDSWFIQSESEYAKLAYNYIDEGLATAIGNGWAHQQINGNIDKDEWYNDKYINGFAHAIYPSVSQHLNANQVMDKDFIEQSIIAFGKTFPNAVNETAILFNELQLYADADDKVARELIQKSLFKHFNVRSLSLYTPINDQESLTSMKTTGSTKIIIVAKENSKTLKLLHSQFLSIPNNLDTNSDFIYSLKDKSSKSTIIIINVQSLDKLDQAINALAQKQYIKLGMQAIE